MRRIVGELPRLAAFCLAVLVGGCGEGEAADSAAAGSNANDEPADPGKAGGSGGDEGSGGNSGTGKLRQLGQQCELSAQCDSGFCADGVCCDVACDDVCEQCSAEGTCEAPDEDEQCTAVTCSGDSNECQTVSDDLGIGCKERGTCFSEADCISFEPERTACSEPRDYCDGAGTCETPTISCPSVQSSSTPECEAGAKVCCFADGTNFDTRQCKTSAECVNEVGDKRTGMRCTSQDDCRLGELCSLQTAPGGQIHDCYPTENANEKDGVLTRRQLCEAPEGSWPCVNGTACSYELSSNPLYKYCQLE